MGWMKGLMKEFGHVERMKNDRIAKRVYVGEFHSKSVVKEVD